MNLLKLKPEFGMQYNPDCWYLLPSVMFARASDENEKEIGWMLLFNFLGFQAGIVWS